MVLAFWCFPYSDFRFMTVWFLKEMNDADNIFLIKQLTHDGTEYINRREHQQRLLPFTYCRL